MTSGAFHVRNLDEASWALSQICKSNVIAYSAQARQRARHPCGLGPCDLAY